MVSTVNINGPLDISGGLLDIGSSGGNSIVGGLGANNAYLPSLDMTGGALKIDANALILYGANTLAGGVVEGAGDFYVGGYSSLTIKSGADITASTFELGVALNGNTSLTTLDANFSYTGNFLLDDYSGNNAVLDLNGHTLKLAGTSSFSGTINGPGTLQLLSGDVATFSPPNYAGFYVLGGATVINQGTVNEEDNFQLDGTFDNRAKYNFTTDGGINNEGSVTVTNEGTFTKTAGTGTSTIYGAFTTTGVVNVKTGWIAVNGSGGTLSGTIEGAGGFALEYNGVYTLSSTLALTSGSFAIDNTDGNGGGAAELIFTTNLTYGGAFYAGSVFADTNLDLAGWTLTLTGAATFTAPYGVVDITGGGAVILAGGSTAAIDSTDFFGGVSLTNSGTLTDNGAIVFDSDGGSSQSELNNTSTGVIDIGDVQNAINEGGTSALIVNAGKIDKTSGTGETDIYIVLDNTGTLEADSGVLAVHNGGEMGGTLSGAGAIALRGYSVGYTLESALTLSVANFYLWDSVQVTFDEGINYSGVFYEGGSFSDTELLLKGHALTLNGSATFTAAYGSVTIEHGTVSLTKTATTNIDDINIDSGVTFKNAGLLDDNLYVVLDADGSSTSQSLLDNLSTGVIDFNGDGQEFSSGGSTALIENAGKIDKTAGTGNSDVSVVVDNTGTIEADSGAIVLHNGGSMGGKLIGAGEIVFRGSAAYTLTSALTLSVANFELWDSADVTFGKSFTYGGVFYEGGSFSNTELLLGGYTLTLSGTATFTAAYGAVTIEGGTVSLTKTAKASIDDTYIDGGVTFKNAGTLDDNLYVYLDADGGSAQSLLSNLATGVIDITGDGDAIDAKGSAALVNNAGKIDKTAGTGTSDIYVLLHNTGTLESDTGTIVLHDGAALSGTVSGAGAITLRGSADYTLSSSLTLSVAGLNLWDSADLTFGKNFTYSGAFFEGGSFSNTALLLGGHTLTLSGSATFTAPYGYATIEDGTVYLKKGATGAIDDTYIDGGATFENGGTLDDNLYVYLDADGGSSQSLFDNLGSGVVNITAGGPAFEQKGASAFIENAGLIDANLASGGTTISVAVTNTGKLEVQSGTFDLQDAISGTGSDIISGASTMQFDGTVAAGQKASFTGADGVLDLTNFGNFHGSISGFDTVGSGDTINVSGPWTWVGFTENGAGTQGAMTFSNGTTDASVTLIGNYNALNFQPKVGNGVTQVTYT